jgi:hypothetical protein
MTFSQRIELARLRRRALREARAELEAYSERELNSDLRLSRSDIPELARAMAQERVAAHRRRHHLDSGGGLLRGWAEAWRRTFAIYGGGAWGSTGR